MKTTMYTLLTNSTIEFRNSITTVTIVEFGQDRLDHSVDVAVDSQGRVYASDFDEILIYVPTV